jgi:hypothetical protein
VDVRIDPIGASHDHGNHHDHDHDDYAAAADDDDDEEAEEDEDEEDPNILGIICSIFRWPQTILKWLHPDYMPSKQLANFQNPH